MSGPVMKVAVLAIFGTASALVIRRSNGELAILLALSVCVCALCMTLKLIAPILEFGQHVKRMVGLSGIVCTPVLKCVGIGLTSRIASDLCRDGGQKAMSSAVELTGAVGALYVSLPLLTMLLDMLEELL